MAQIEYQIVPDEYYSIKDINRLIEALEKRMKVREVMRIEHAMKFLGIGRSQIDRMCKNGHLPFHCIEGLSGKLFLRSELIEFIKRH